MSISQKSAPTSAIDLLASIAQKLREVAGEIDNAALTIEEGQAKNSQEAEKLKQLKALFKELA